VKRNIAALIAVFFAVGAAVLMFSPSPAFAKRKKISVAVAKFADSSGKNLGDTATDYTTNTFIKLKYFKILERSRISQVMQELAHQQTGLVDENTAIEVGKQLGAKVIVVGNVSGAGYEIKRETCVVFDSKGNRRTVPCQVATATVTLTVRMVNVETGEVIFSDTLNGSESETYKGRDRPASPASMINKALQKAAYHLYRPIQKAFPLEGKVIKKDGKVILVSIGSDWGIAKGRGVKIYSTKGAELRDPDTGEVIGYERTLVAKDHVGQVFPTHCQLKLSKKEAAKVQVGDIVVFKPEIFY